MRLRITPKRWYRSYKLPGGQPRNPRWKPSSFLAIPPSLGNHFFFLFFTILSSPLGPSFASCCSCFLSLSLSAAESCLPSPTPSSFLSYLSQPERLRHRFIRGPSTKIIITIMIKAGTTCCVRWNIGRGPRYGKLQEEEGQRKERGRGSFTCRPGAIVFFFVFHLRHVLPCHFSLNRQPSIFPAIDWERISASRSTVNNDS